MDVFKIIFRQILGDTLNILKDIQSLFSQSDEWKILLLTTSSWIIICISAVTSREWGWIASWWRRRTRCVSLWSCTLLRSCCNTKQKNNILANLKKKKRFSSLLFTIVSHSLIILKSKLMGGKPESIRFETQWLFYGVYVLEVSTVWQCKTQTVTFLLPES